MQEDGGFFYPLPQKQSGFKTITNGVIEKIHVNAEKHGLNCMNPGHQGSVNNLKTDALDCDNCERSGPPIKHRRKQWGLHLSPIISTRPIFIVVLGSRSSIGQEINQEVYDDMRMCVVTNQR